MAVVLGRPAEASAHLAAAVALGRQLGDDRALLAALAEQGRIALLIRGEFDASWVDEGLAVLPRVDDPLTRVRFLRQLGTVGIIPGDHDLARARLEDALAIDLDEFQRIVDELLTEDDPAPDQAPTRDPARGAL